MRKLGPVLEEGFRDCRIRPEARQIPREPECVKIQMFKRSVLKGRGHFS